MKLASLAIVAVLATYSSTALAINYVPFYRESIGFNSGPETSIEFGKHPVVYMAATAANNSTVRGEIGYSFLISGGPANSFVPVTFEGNFSVSFQSDVGVGGGRWSQARFAIGASDRVFLPDNTFRGAALQLDAQCRWGGCTSILGKLPTSNYTDNGTSSITVDFEYSGATSLWGSFHGTLYAPTDSLGQSAGSVGLVAAAGSHSFKSTTYIDPHLEIDPAWLATNGGSQIVLPTGVGNEIMDNPFASPVPEPHTFWLAMLGLPVLGLARRARGRRSSAAN